MSAQLAAWPAPQPAQFSVCSHPVLCVSQGHVPQAHTDVPVIQGSASHAHHKRRIRHQDLERSQADSQPSRRCVGCSHIDISHARRWYIPHTVGRLPFGWGQSACRAGTAGPQGRTGRLRRAYAAVQLPAGPVLGGADPHWPAGLGPTAPPCRSSTEPAHVPVWIGAASVFGATIGRGCRACVCACACKLGG